MKGLLKHLTAWLPLVLSPVIALLIIITIIVHGMQPTEDEGTVAHIFQLLVLSELVIIGIFVINFFPKEPKATIKILILQILALIFVCAPVFIFNF